MRARGRAGPNQERRVEINLPLSSPSDPPSEETNPGTDGDEVVAFFAASPRGFLAVLRHVW